MRAVRAAVVLLVALGPLLVATAVGGKMPFYAIRIRPEVAPVGQGVRIVVRFSWDEDHSRPARWFAPTWLELIPLDAAGQPVVADGVGLRFEEVTPSRYVARVVPPHPGTWWVVGWPSNGVEPPSAPDAPGLPGTVPLRVLDAEGPAATGRAEPGGLGGGFAVAAGAVLLVAAAATLGLRRRRSVAAR